MFVCSTEGFHKGLLLWALCFIHECREQERGLTCKCDILDMLKHKVDEHTLCWCENVAEVLIDELLCERERLGVVCEHLRGPSEDMARELVEENDQREDTVWGLLEDVECACVCEMKVLQKARLDLLVDILGGAEPLVSVVSVIVVLWVGVCTEPVTQDLVCKLSDESFGEDTPECALFPLGGEWLCVLLEVIFERRERVRWVSLFGYRGLVCIGCHGGHCSTYAFVNWNSEWMGSLA